MAIQNSYPALRPSLLLDFANSRQLDPRITFTRSTTATYYDGVTTAKAEENLLTYSQEFDNAVWSKTASTVTANSTTAPDGTSTADTLTETATTNYHSTYQTNISLAATSYTFSCFAKPNGRNEITLVMLSGSDIAYATYNVSTGSITVAATTSGSFSSASTTITASANGFYRVTLTATAPSTSTATLAIELYNAARTYAGNGTSGVYLWGAQLEQRSSITAYTATTSQAITNYIPVLQTAAAGQARFDHNPTTGESLGLLIEEARTNVMTYSEDFSAWSLGATTVTSNTVVSPNGSINGDLIASTGTTDSHDVFLAQTTGATAITASVYVKNRSGQYIYVALSNTANGTDFSTVSFDITNGTYGTVTTAGNFTGGSASITSVGNSWYRVSITATSNASSNYVFIGISSGFNPSYSPRGRVQTTNTNSFFAWGAQLEAGSFATSYIPTTSASVTRTADAASMTGTNFSSWFNNAQGTLYAEQYITNVTAGSVNNQTAACLYKDSSNFIATGQGVGDAGGTGQRSFVWVQTNNSTQVFAGTGNFITVGLTLKNAVAYETNNFAYSANTQTLITDTSGTVPAVNSLSIGFYLVGINYYANNPIRKIAFYPVRVTNAQLQALTS